MKAKSKINKAVYSPAGIIIRLAELGLDESEIAYSLDLSKRKFETLKKQKEISEALAKGLETRARRVENALYRRAVGFEYEETVNAVTAPSASARLDKSELTGLKENKTGSHKAVNGNSAAEKSSAKSTIKTVIPDVTACIFWLKNMLPEKWRDPKDVISPKKTFVQALEELDEKSDIEGTV